VLQGSIIYGRLALPPPVTLVSRQKTVGFHFGHPAVRTVPLWPNS